VMTRKIKHVNTFAGSQSNVSQVIPRLVDAVTTSDNFLFVLRRPSLQQIEVYETETFTSRQVLRIEGHRSDLASYSCGMAASSSTEFIFVSDTVKNIVFKILLTNRPSLKIRSVIPWPKLEEGSIPTALSLNSKGNVIVTNPGKDRIEEYRADGERLRWIELNTLKRPQHALQVMGDVGDLFYVSHSGPEYGVSLINSSGQVIEQYSPGDIGTIVFKSPRHLAIDSRGNVIVADSGNDRIIILDSSLKNARELSVSTKDELQVIEPWSIHLRESVNGDLLYVGEGTRGRRVILLDCRECLKWSTN